MSSQTAERIAINDTTLYVETAGAGETIIFLHAGIADTRMWDKQWAIFANQYQVVRYDRPGYGHSPATEGLRTHRGDLLALMDALGIEQAHLVGCSMGGELALDFGLEHPERVASLTIVCSPAGGFAMQGEPPKQIGEFFTAMHQGDGQRVAEIASQMFVVGDRRTPDQVSAEVQQLVIDMTRTIFANGVMMTPDAEPLTPVANERLSEIQVPLLAIVGEYDHPEIARGAKEMVEATRNGQMLTIANAAHLPSLEQPTEFNRILNNFLSQR